MSSVASRHLDTHVVTGGSSGIGRAIAGALAERGHRVVIVCRDRGRGEAACEAIRARSAGAVVDLVTGDLGSLAGCKAAASALLEQQARVDVLIHNAGVWPTQLERNEDGLERGFAVNSLAPFVLNHLLRERLSASGTARIVQVTAGLYAAGRASPERTPTGADFHRLRTYASTKLWNLVCTLELARRLEGSGITVNAVHPGVVRTGLGDMPGVAGLILRGIKRWWASPEQGAAGPVHLAVSPDIAALSGAYFDERRRAPLQAVAEDRALARALWERTAELAGLDGASS